MFEICVVSAWILRSCDANLRASISRKISEMLTQFKRASQKVYRQTTFDRRGITSQSGKLRFSYIVCTSTRSVVFYRDDAAESWAAHVDPRANSRFDAT